MWLPFLPALHYLLVAQVLVPTGTPDIILTFVQYGAIGLIVFALIRGWIWAKPSVDQLLAAIGRLTDENAILRDELNKIRHDHEGCEEDMRRLRERLEKEMKRR